jgi:hypothetical protein
MNKDEIAVHQAVEADEQDKIWADVKRQQEALRPKLQPVANTWTADRWVGTRGINPLNESERKLLEACEKDGVSFAEKKTRLLRMRADMSKLKPTKLSI